MPVLDRTGNLTSDSATSSGLPFLHHVVKLSDTKRVSEFSQDHLDPDSQLDARNNLSL